jgi:hypothetical protein
MARVAILVLLVGSVSSLRDVPKGECYQCEVTCFEDCALKYDREIMQMDFLQLDKATKGKENQTQVLTDAYGKCLIDDQCPCRAAQAQAKSKALTLVDKKKGKCAVNAVPCSAKCAQKALTKKQDTQSKLALLKSFSQTMIKKDYPLHSVKINVFAKGGMLMDQCLKYCLAATCGCEDAPGFEKLEETVKASAGMVTDTPGSPQYKPAKIEECAKGMIGKKVASGLYIKLGGGPMDYVEVCTPKFLSAVGAPEGAAAKCKSGASDDSKFGCVWHETKNMCVVGFSPILKCMTQYFNDPTP